MTAAKRRRLQLLLKRFSGKRVLVVGDLMLDHYIRGGVSRISPEAPVPVVTVSSESTLPGGAGNVASNLAALGARVEVVGVVGADDAGTRLIDDLRAKGVASSGIVVDPSRVTSQKSRVVAERQQVVRFDREASQPLPSGTVARIMEGLAVGVASADALILSDYGKGAVSPAILRAAISACRRRGIPVVVDPKVENFSLYKGVTCLTPNLQEAWDGMRRKPQPGAAALEELGRSILRSLRCRSLIITRGGDGMSLFRPGMPADHIPTQAREVFDVSGAGDTVIAALTLGLSCGADFRDAALISNYAAGIVVGKLGTATAAAAEIRGVLE